MWTTDRPSTAAIPATRFLAALVSGVVAVGVAALVFAAIGHPDSARGAVVGGSAMIALFVALRWRAVHRADAAGPAARVGAGVGDERDRAIMTQALATTGAFSFVTITGLCVALVCGAPALPAVTIAAFVHYGVFVAAFALHARRG